MEVLQNKMEQNRSGVPYGGTGYEMGQYHIIKQTQEVISQSPTVLPGRGMSEFDLPSCQVMFLIDRDDQKRTLPISPRMTIRTLASWDSINTTKETLRYSRRRAYFV